MIKTIVEDQFAVSPRTAFDFTAEMRNLDQWGVGVKEVRQTSGDGPGIGAIYECTMLAPHFGPKAYYRMQELETGKLIVMSGETSFLKFKDSYYFEPVGNGVRVTIVDELQLQGWVGFLEGMLVPLMKNQIQQDLKNLKTALATFAPASSPRLATKVS